MNEIILNQKLQSLTRFKQLDIKQVQYLGDWVRRADDWQLFRINPLRFANEHGIAESASLDLFIHGAKIGLFDFSYNMVCPYCGGVEYTHNALDEITSDEFYCTVCDTSIPITLDQQVQVTFTLNPSLRPLDINPYAGLWDYLRYYFTSDLQRTPEIQNKMRQNAIGFGASEPDKDFRITFQAQAGETYRLASLDYHTVLLVHVTQEQASMPQVVDIDLILGGLTPREVTLPAGEVMLVIHNRTKGMAGADLFRRDPEVIAMMTSGQGSTWHPYLTGKMLLTNQSFRDLFRIQNLAPDLKLNIRSLTIMFTDLKSSTDLYRKIGDVAAYSLVQEHFDLLTQSVRRHSGSIVKTMGDAIMATFGDAQSGVLAALEVTQQIEKMRQRLQAEGHDWGIKIGLSEGAVLAVNADERLDYFGQNVNVAARVQGLAQSGEIWMTDTVYVTPGVAEVLEQYRYTSRQQAAMLKGVGDHTVVYQCRPK